MKQMSKNIQMLAALLMAGVAFTSCSSDVEDAVGPVGPTLVKTYTMTVDAAKGNDVITRALTDNTSTLTNTWETSDKIYVKRGETWATGNLAPQSAGATAQLKGSLSGVTFVVGDMLTLQYPSSSDADYTTGQDGTLEKIASTYDYSKAENVKVTAVNADNITTEAASFVSQQAVVKFTLKNGDADLAVTGLKVNVNSVDDYTITPASATNVLYVALPAFSDQTITLTATGSDSKTYTYTKTSVSFSNGTYYRVNVKMTAASTPGALTGAFTIDSNGTQVHFAKGNLQYQASTSTWRFADNQWDYVGDASNGNVYVSSTKSNNASISSSYTGWIDLFGWGTSGHLFASGYGSAYQPWSTTSTTNTAYGPTDGTSGLTGTYAEGDWGTNMGSGWRTLTKDEWQWMLGPSSSATPGENCRTSSTIGVTNARWVKAVVHNINGLIIFPDGLTWDATTMGTAPTTINTANNNFTYNTLTDDQWSALEAAGCVFLPAAGNRYGTTVYNAGSYGYYWSSTPYNAYRAYCVYFYSGSLNPAYYYNRDYGYSVRLVRQVE